MTLSFCPWWSLHQCEESEDHFTPSRSDQITQRQDPPRPNLKIWGEVALEAKALFCHGVNTLTHGKVFRISTPKRNNVLC